jgi:hypothetical protein
VRRQERQLDLAASGVEIFAHQLAQVRFQRVSHDQQGSRQVSAQRLGQLKVLVLLDRALVHTDQAVRAGQTGDHPRCGCS